MVVRTARRGDRVGGRRRPKILPEVRCEVAAVEGALGDELSRMDSSWAHSSASTGPTCPGDRWSSMVFGSSRDRASSGVFMMAPPLLAPADIARLSEIIAGYLAPATRAGHPTSEAWS